MCVCVDDSFRPQGGVCVSGFLFLAQKPKRSPARPLSLLATPALDQEARAFGMADSGDPTPCRPRGDPPLGEGQLSAKGLSLLQ